MLQGKKLRLRALEPSDTEVLYRWENSSSAWLVSGTLTPFSKHVIAQYISSSHNDIYINRQLRLMLEPPGADPVGCIDLFDFDPANRRAGVGILIGDVSQRRKGYASEALSLLRDYCFGVLHLHQLYAHIAAGNKESMGLFIKCGFEESGVLKQWSYQRERWIDEHIMQCINKNTRT